MKYYKTNGVHVIECSVNEFAIVMKSDYKKNLKENTYTNANFFANFSENGVKFTLPVGHLVCDFDSSSVQCKKYCTERGKFNGKKFCFDSGSFKYMNQFYGKYVSTFTIKNGKPKIEDLLHVDLSYTYAVAGVPIIRNGQDVKFKTYVTGQGWDGSTLYATKHIFVGLKPNNNNIFIMGWQSTKANMIYSGETYKKFSALGFSDVIKLDGGGSYVMKCNGTVVDSTLENRMDNAYIVIRGANSVVANTTYSKPTRTLQKNDKGNDVKWVQERLNKVGYNLVVDGSFGPASQKALQDFCVKKLETA